MENSYQTVRAEPSIPGTCRNDRVEKNMIRTWLLDCRVHSVVSDISELHSFFV